MKRTTLLTIACCLAFSSLYAGVASDQRHNEERYKSDPAALRALDPNFEEFPDSSLVDFSYLLDAPAGKYGKVEVGPDGHFQFSKTKNRVRFWGVTVAASNIDIPKRRIKEAVDAISHSGCNLLRLHEIDNRGGEQYNLVRRNIIDDSYPNNKDSRHFDAEYRDRVDYWIKCAKDRGMYVYLVVRGYRTFREGDGVPNADKLGRSAKPYAFFNRRLIDLQKEYADQWLIKHINPYTGMANGLDPAVALIEIENEDSLFFNASDWNNLVEPYRIELQGLWNDYLFKKYQTTDALRMAWSNDSGLCALSPEESLEKKNIVLPGMPTRNPENISKVDFTDPKLSPVRCSDGARFAVELQRAYFKEMRDFLRSKGCTVPMTAVVNAGVAPDVYSVAAELDFTGENDYLDHPAFQPGATWVGMSNFSNKNYIKESGIWSMMGHMAGYKWAGKPLVCREWATCWPNAYRVSSVMEIASYSLLNDYDGLIYFCYDTFGNNKISETFGLQADPLRWGMMGYGARLFLQGDVKAAKKAVEISYTDDDLYTWGNYENIYKTLAWTHRVENRLIDPLNPSQADIQIPVQRALAAQRGSYPKEPAQVMEEVRAANLPLLKSEDGSLARDTNKGYAYINTSSFLCLQGEIEPYKEYSAGKMKVLSSSSVALIVMASLDGKPLEQSDHFSLKMATVAINRGQRLDPMKDADNNDRYLLVNLGAPPVQTMGKPADKPTSISLDGKPLLDAYLENGTWEMEVDKTNRKIRLFCDTPNTRFIVYPVTEKGWEMQKFYQEYPAGKAEAISRDLVYPGFSKYIELKDTNKPEKKKTEKKEDKKAKK